MTLKEFKEAQKKKFAEKYAGKSIEDLSYSANNAGTTVEKPKAIPRKSGGSTYSWDGYEWVENED